MELEKSIKADLKNKLGLSLNVIIFIVIGFSQYAFTNAEKTTKIESLSYNTTSAFIEEMTSITRHEELKAPLPAAIEILNIAIDETKKSENINTTNSVAVKDAKLKIAFIQIPTEEKQTIDDEVFVVVEIMPAFPGGDLAMRRFIAKAIKYPTLAEEKGIQGRVFVKFVVNKDGSVSDAKIARGVDPALDKEAIRVIMSLPKWKPGMQHGKAVNVSFMFPISFQLQ